MEIKEMDVKQLEERKAAIATEVDNEGADLEALAAEVKSINEELEARKAEAEKWHKAWYEAYLKSELS